MNYAVDELDGRIRDSRNDAVVSLLFFRVIRDTFLNSQRIFCYNKKTENHNGG